MSLERKHYIRSQKRAIRQERQRGLEAQGSLQMHQSQLNAEKNRNRATKGLTAASALGAAYALGRRRPYSGFAAMAGVGAGATASRGQERRIKRISGRVKDARGRALFHNENKSMMQAELDYAQPNRTFEKSLVSKGRRVPSPLAQFAAAGMIKQGLGGLGFMGKMGQSGVGVPRSMIAGSLAGPYDVLMTKLKRKGLTHAQARAAALRLIYAQNLAGKMI